MVLTQEQRHEVRNAGEGPVRVTDPETNQEYVVVRAELFDRLRRAFEEVDPSFFEFEAVDGE